MHFDRLYFWFSSNRLWAMLPGSRWPRPVQLIRDAGQGSKVEESTSKVLRFEIKVLKLKYTCDLTTSITATTPALVTMVIFELMEHYSFAWKRRTETFVSLPVRSFGIVDICESLQSAARWDDAVAHEAIPYREHISNGDPNCGHQLVPKLKTL